MKEVTFYELIMQLFPNHELTKDRWSFELIQFSADDLIEFGIKVREATKDECHLIADKYYFQNSEKIIIDINSLPTDRVKIENKE